MIAERPRITWIRRRQPGEISIGDSAEARLAPGLIGLLEAIAPKSGFHAPYNIPASLAGTAAVAVVSSPTTNWTGRDLEVEWQGTPGPHDAVFAEARLEQYSERLAAFAIRGRTQANQPLFHGTLRLTGIRDGMPAGFRSREEYEQLRQQFPKTNPEQIGLGHTVWIEIPAGANVELPFGRGLSIEAIESSRILVRADRPHEVNLGRPWELKVGATTIPIRVPDPNPGRTFYILTEDCETFDGGPLTGNYAGSEHLGNHNNFMDPEDYRVQMIAKPNRLNEIAERYGARWTHFYCATQRFGAEWAAKQSLTGEWPKVIAEMDASVREGSRHHEYSPHIHFDYEPDSKLPPQPRLVYDPATDGILPNDYYHPETNPRHHYHDWDGSARGIAYIKKLGDLNELDSKAGSMRKSMRHLARLQVNRRAPLVARTGSYDFGKSPEDQTISTQAFEANGLRGNSDAYRPGGAPTAGGQMFWCAAHDRYAHIKDLHDARLVQFGITMD